MSASIPRSSWRSASRRRFSRARCVSSICAPRPTAASWRSRRAADGRKPAAPEHLPPAPGGVFDNAVWSRDGKRLAGVVRQPSGRLVPAIYALDSKSYRLFDVEGTDPVIWVNGDRGLLFMRAGAVLALDVASGREHAVVTRASLGRAGAGEPIFTYALSGDERSLFLVFWRDQADVWQLTLP